MQEKVSTKRVLGFFTLTSIGVGTVIGSGIFALPASLSAVAGPSMIISVLLSGIICLLFALAYAELGSTFPLTGGPYAFTKLSMGNLSGFIVGWGYFLFLFVGTAAISDIFVVYLGFYFDGLSIRGTLTPLGVTIAVLMLWFLTFINILGMKWGGLYSLIMTVLKVLFLVLFCFTGFFAFKETNFTPFFPYGISGVTLGITLFFWSFTGFETISVPAEEIIKPAKNIPRAIISSVLISLFVYVLIAFVFAGMVSWKSLHGSVRTWTDMTVLSSPLASVAKELNLAWLAGLATIGAIISTAGTIGASVLVQGRIPYAMAKDRLLFMHLAEIHPRFSTPVRSLVFSSLLATIILIAIPNFPSVALIASITVIVPYAAAMISLTILRKTHAEEARPFKLPFAQTISLLGFIFATFLVYWGTWPWTLVGAIIMLLGYIPFYLFKFKETHFIRSAWIIVYLVGIVFISFIGDPTFVFNNFTPFTPKGWLLMPYDLIVLAIFAVGVYFWAYSVNIQFRPESKSLGAKEVSPHS